MILNELSNGKYYHYEISDGGNGIVKADSKEEACTKLVNAYRAHGQNLTDNDISINMVDQKPFPDSPDVLEISEF